MIKNVAQWERWRAQEMGSEPADFERNLKLMEAMYEHVRRMGAFVPSDDTERLQHKIRMARALNGRRTP